MDEDILLLGDDDKKKIVKTINKLKEEVKSLKSIVELQSKTITNLNTTIARLRNNNWYVK